MGRLNWSGLKAGLVDRAREWEVFCAPGDAEPIHNISLQTDRGRAPLPPGYVSLSTVAPDFVVDSMMSAPDFVDSMMSVRLLADRALLERMGMDENGERWRVLALAVVDDAAGEVYLAKYLPSAVVWSIRPVRQVDGSEHKRLLDVTLVGHVDSGEGFAYRKTFAGPGWVARLAEAGVPVELV